MKKTKRIITAITLSISLILGLVACGTEETANKDTNSDTNSESVAKTDGSNSISEEFTIRVGVNSGDGNHLLSILDKHTGFLKEQGINLEVTEFAAGINTIDAITTGQLDVGLFADYAGVNRIGNTLNDTELRAFATINSGNTFQLYVDPEKISTPEDIAGQTVISMAGVVVEYDYGKLFEKYGIDPETVTFANTSSAQEGLAIAQAGDAVANWTARQTASLYDEIGWVPILSLEDVDAIMYTYLVANDSYLKEHHDEVVKYLKVSDDAFKYIEENKDEFFTWVEEDLGLKKDLAIISWDSSNHEYYFSQESFDDLIKVEKWCYSNGNFDTDYDFGDFVNTDALKEAFPDRVDWTRN